MIKQYSSDLKLKAIKYYLKTKNYFKTCNVFDCSTRSLKRWIERFVSTGNVNRKPRNTKSYKITRNHIKFIKRTIKVKPDILMK